MLSSTSYYLSHKRIPKGVDTTTKRTTRGARFGTNLEANKVLCQVHAVERLELFPRDSAVSAAVIEVGM